MSKPIVLVFALLILTTILCNSSVRSQRRTSKDTVVCGCRILPNNTIKCTKKHNVKTNDYNEIIKCICRNRENNMMNLSKRFLKICKSYGPSIPL